jgi:hypothetical protein
VEEIISYIAIPIEQWDKFKRKAFKETIMPDVVELEQNSQFIQLTDEELHNVLEK